MMSTNGKSGGTCYMFLGLWGNMELLLGLIYEYLQERWDCSILNTLRAKIAFWKRWRKMSRQRRLRERFQAEMPACSTWRSLLCQNQWEGAYVVVVYFLWFNGIMSERKIQDLWALKSGIIRGCKFFSEIRRGDRDKERR